MALAPQLRVGLIATAMAELAGLVLENDPGGSVMIGSPVVLRIIKSSMYDGALIEPAFALLNGIRDNMKKLRSIAVWNGINLILFIMYTF